MDPGKLSEMDRLRLYKTLKLLFKDGITGIIIITR